MRQQALNKAGCFATQAIARACRVEVATSQPFVVFAHTSSTPELGVVHQLSGSAAMLSCRSIRVNP